MFNVQKVKIEEITLTPGMVFKDAEGVLWVALVPQGEGEAQVPIQRPSTHAACVWHTPDATRNRDYESNRHIGNIPPPFTFITDLSEVR